MNLTPLDIRRHQFAKAFRGYEPTEVDTFLKQVSDQLEAMLDEVRHANERVRDAEAKLTHYEKVELALQEALESARESGRRAEAQAEAKAKLIIEEAELKAQRLVHDAERERYGLRQDLSKLNNRQAEVAARLRGFLLSELEILAQFQGDDPVGFIKLQSAEASGGSLPPSRPAQLSAGEDREAADEPPAPMPPASEPAPPHDSLDEDDVPEPSPEALPPQEAPPRAPEPPPEAPRSEASPAAPSEPTPPETDAWPTPTAESPASGAYLSEEPDAPETEADAPPPAEEMPSEPESPRPQPAVTGGWDLRSLVTGEERSVAASEAERERIRRILDDLD